MPPQFTKRRTRPEGRIPNCIRDYRLKAGLSQQRLSELIGHSPDSISSWERGRHLPTVTNLFRLARTLDTLAEALYWDLYRPEGSPKTVTTKRR